MPKRPPPGKNDRKTNAQRVVAVDINNIDVTEKETLEKVEKALMALNFAIAIWNASKTKPKELELKFIKYERLREALSYWQKRMNSVSRDPQNFDERVRCLWDFADICDKYA